MRRKSPPVFEARWFSGRDALDGRADKSPWAGVRAYAFEIPRVEAERGKRLNDGVRGRQGIPGAMRRRPVEGATVAFAWDGRELLVLARMEDSDIVAEGPDVAAAYHLFGDVFELFLKREDRIDYWEIHVTPLNQTAVLHIPGRGRLGLASCAGKECGLRSAVKCDGRVNDLRTRGRGWTVELAVPLGKLAGAVPPAGGRVRWRVLAGRYNYSRFLETRGPELSSAPGVEAVDFHRYEEYARLKLPTLRTRRVKRE